MLRDCVAWCMTAPRCLLPTARRRCWWRGAGVLALAVALRCWCRAGAGRAAGAAVPTLARSRTAPPSLVAVLPVLPWYRLPTVRPGPFAAPGGSCRPGCCGAGAAGRHPADAGRRASSARAALLARGNKKRTRARCRRKKFFYPFGVTWAEKRVAPAQRQKPC